MTEKNDQINELLTTFKQRTTKEQFKIAFYSLNTLKPRIITTTQS